MEAHYESPYFHGKKEAHRFLNETPAEPPDVPARLTESKSLRHTLLSPTILSRFRSMPQADTVLPPQITRQFCTIFSGISATGHAGRTGAEYVLPHDALTSSAGILSPGILFFFLQTTASSPLLLPLHVQAFL